MSEPSRGAAAAEDPWLHFLPSVAASAVGGWLAGWLLFSERGFSERGQAVLDRLGA